VQGGIFCFECGEFFADWGPDVGANLWRTTGDIAPTFNRITLIGREQAGLSRYSGHMPM
jgi:hypothetical protein